MLTTKAITFNGENPVYPQFHFVYTHGNCLANSDTVSCWRIPEKTRLIWFSLVPLGRVSILGPESVQFIYDVFNDEFLTAGITIDTNEKTIDTNEKFIESIKRIKTKIYLQLLEKNLKIQNQVDNSVSKINTAKEQIRENTSILEEKKAKTEQIKDEYSSKRKEIDELEDEIDELKTEIAALEINIDQLDTTKLVSTKNILEIKNDILKIKKEILETILENFKRSLIETGDTEFENTIAEHTISSNEPDLRDYINYGRLLLEPDKILECRIYNSGDNAPQKKFSTDGDLLGKAVGIDWDIINQRSPNPIKSNRLPPEDKPGSFDPIPMFKREDVKSEVQTNIREIVSKTTGLHIVVDGSCSSVFHEKNEEQEIISTATLDKLYSQCGKGMSIDIGESVKVRVIQNQIGPYYNRLIAEFTHLFPEGGSRIKKRRTKITKKSCKKCKKMKTKKRRNKARTKKRRNKRRTNKKR